MRRSTKTLIGRISGGSELFIGLIIIIVALINIEKIRYFIQSLSLGTVLVILGIVFLINYNRPQNRRWFY